MIWTPIPPPGIALYKSQTFQFTCTGDGKDMVYSWSINGAPGGGGVPPAPDAFGASYIYPWEAVDICIRGVELICVPSAPGAVMRPGWPAISPRTFGMRGPHLPDYSFLMAGNNATGDTMLFMAAGQMHARHDFPAGCGMPFPGIPDKNPQTYLNLHGNCSPGYDANVMYVIYYTVETRR
jgi:hypothetical protein